MNFVPLTDSQVKSLEELGNVSEQWDRIMVKPGFTPGKIINVRFAGDVRLGSFDGTVIAEDGIPRLAGLYNCFLENCSIGDGNRIANVSMLSGYDTGSEVLIEDVSCLAVTGETSFGNGTGIRILNESGGREMPISDILDAQAAYMMVTRRHEMQFVRAMFKMVSERAEAAKSSCGKIGANCIIRSCGNIKNVSTGSHAVIRGASLLEEGTISSFEKSPSFIGDGVIAKNFILLDGSRIDGAAWLQNCFVGQGVKIDRQFCAENSVFFANCEAYCGEAASLFAGPYTVTHHKSTLLIAAMLSFHNAGSGSNPSNHMYKTGPVPQGIMDRGVKSGSSSYLLWPGRVGAFSVVIGKHYSNLDTSSLPFSYLFESPEGSLLVPAANLFSSGIKRDIVKWPTLDRRHGEYKSDLVHFDVLTPYTVGKIVEAKGVLESCTGRKNDFIEYNGVLLQSSKIGRAIENYETAIRMYIGDAVSRRLGDSDFSSLEDLKKTLDARCQKAAGRWIDMAGMLAPAGMIDDVATEVAGEKIASMEEFHRRMEEIHGNYEEYNLAWCISLVEKREGKKLGDFAKKDFIRILEEWRDGHREAAEQTIKDAEKDFSITNRIGYGIDGDEKTRDMDFAAVRGDFNQDNFISELKTSLDQIQKTASGLIDRIEGCGR